MVYVTQVCWQLASRIWTELSSVLILLALLCVRWKTPDDGQRNCPKHVEFYSKNKSKKLMHLVGLIIRIYHDAPSPERQNLFCFLFLKLDRGPHFAHFCKADIFVKKQVLICRRNQNLLNRIALYSVTDRICNRFIYSRPTQQNVITVIPLPSP